MTNEFQMQIHVPPIKVNTEDFTRQIVEAAQKNLDESKEGILDEIRGMVASIANSHIESLVTGHVDALVVKAVSEAINFQVVKKAAQDELRKATRLAVKNALSKMKDSL